MAASDESAGRRGLPRDRARPARLRRDRFARRRSRRTRSASSSATSSACSTRSRFRSCVIVGHDWGGMVAWNTALMAPDSVERVIGINTPFIPRAPMKPTERCARWRRAAFTTFSIFKRRAWRRRNSNATSRARCAASTRIRRKIDPAEIRKAAPGVFGPAGGGIARSIRRSSARKVSHRRGLRGLRQRDSRRAAFAAD